MNHVYKLVWNTLNQSWVAVAEIASGQGGRKTARAHRGARRPAIANAALSSFKVHAVAVAVAVGVWLGLLPLPSGAQTVAPTVLPQGGVVAQGAAVIQAGGLTTAPVLNIDQSSQRAVINWNSFNVGSASTVNFNQPNAQSATLNRVMDMQPTQILGKIQAPGQVTMINPAGIYFSSGAVLDVGALTASTLGQTDADFMAGMARFTRNGSTGSLVNEGRLTAADYIALLAPEVRNQGVVEARAVTMAAGEDVQLNFDPFSRLASISVTRSQIAALVENRSAIVAPGGLIILSATALNGLQSSIISSGDIDASSLVAQGGRIVLEADRVTLQSGSRTLATGATGGGTILAGGDWQGSGTMVQATRAELGRGADVDASATVSGNGGKVVIWSDVNNSLGSTTAYGRIAANAGAGGGNGGQIETSGHHLDVAGAQVSARAQGGVAGQWLLDPYDIQVLNAGGTAPGTPAPGSGNFTSGSASVILASDISAALSSGTSVTLTTGGVAGDGLGNGDIQIGVTAATAGQAINITHSGADEVTLTLNAHRTARITNFSTIESTAGKLNVVFNGDSDGIAGGSVVLDASSQINTRGGNITLGGGTAGNGTGYAKGITSGIPEGVFMAGSLNAGGGNIALTGQGFAGTNNTYGVTLRTGSSVATTGAGNITMTGITGNGVGASNSGVYIVTSIVTADAGTIFLNGANLNATANGYGVVTVGNTAILANTGAINIDGGVRGVQFANGTLGRKAGTAVTSSSSNITIRGDTLAVTGATTIDTAGALVIRPLNTSFSAAQNYANLTVTGSLSGLTLGKAGNLADMTTNTRNIAGPITVYGGNVNINQGLSTTSPGASITVIAAGDIVQAASRTVSTNGGAILYNSDANGDGSGAIVLNSGAILSSGSANITLGGGVAGDGSGDARGNSANPAGISLTGATLNAGNGVINLRGQGFNGALANQYGVALNGSTLTSTGAGAIHVEATGGTGTTGLLIGSGSSVSAPTISVTSDSYSGDGTETVTAGAGSVTLQNRTLNTVVDLGGADVLAGSPLTLGLSASELARITAGSLTVGRDDAAASGKLTVSAATAPVGVTRLTLKTGAGIDLLAPVTLAGSGTLTLSAAGNVQQSGAAAITAANLLLNGPGSSYVLNAAAGNAVGTLAAVSAGNLAFQNGGALQIGSINGIDGIGASGVVSIGTSTGDLTVAQSVSTTDVSASALQLNAGMSSAAGTSGGGNVLISGAANLAAGAGGRATVLTGSVAGSTGLTALVGAGSGRFRYNSDEAVTNFSTPLDTGTFAVYREAPTVNVTANDAVKTFDGIPFSGGNGVTVDPAGLVNGDLTSATTGSLVYGGSAQGAINVTGSPYTLSAGGSASALGYALSFADGTLTINPGPTPPISTSTPLTALTREVLVPGPADSSAALSAAAPVKSGLLIGATGCGGATRVEPDCEGRPRRTGVVVVTQVRHVTPALSGQVLVQVSEEFRKEGAFEARLPQQVSAALGTAASLDARLKNGAALPDWLKWDPQNRTLAGRQMPMGALPTTVLLGAGQEWVEIEVSFLP